jgi:hypothetical protein
VVLVVSNKTRAESASGITYQRSKLEYDEPLSIFAFDFKLRRYTLAQLLGASCAVAASAWNLLSSMPFQGVALWS